GDEAQAHRLGQHVEQALGRLFLTQRRLRAVLQLPVTLHQSLRVAPVRGQPQGEAVGRRQLEHAAEDGSRGRDIPVRQVVVQGEWVHLAGDRRVFEQRLQLGGEDELPVRSSVEQRLLADAITGQEQRLPRFIPYGEGEHAAEVTDTVRT